MFCFGGFLQYSVAETADILSVAKICEFTQTRSIALYTPFDLVSGGKFYLMILGICLI